MQILRYHYNNDAYLMFGSLALYIYKDTRVFAEGNRHYQPFPNKYQLLGKQCDYLKEIEIFQFI